MQKSEIKIGKDYALRELQKPDAPLQRVRVDTDRIDWLERQMFDRDRGLCWRRKYQSKGRIYLAYDGVNEFLGATVRSAIDRALKKI